MSQSELFTLLSSDELFFDHEDLVGACRKTREFGSADEWDSEAGMNEYEERIELAEALATMEW